MKKIFLAMTMAAALFSACSNDTDEIMDCSNGNLRVYGSIEGVQTRVSDAGTEWTVGDAIGVSGASNNNIKYTTSSTSGTFTSTTGIALTADNAAADFTAYYPFSGTEGTAAGEVSFDVTSDANVDFLWASAKASDYAVNFNFAHKMAKVTLDLNEKTEGDIAAGTNVTVSLKGIAAQGTFNTATGAVSPSATAATISKTIQWGASNTVSLIVPSYTEAQTVKVAIVVGEKNFEGTITPALAAGNNYKYTVTINPKVVTTELTISTATLTGWSDIIGSSLNADETEPEPEPLPVKATPALGDFLLSNGKVLDKEFDLSTISSYSDGAGVSAVAVVVYTGDLSSNEYGLSSYNAIAMTVAQTGAKWATSEYYNASADDLGMMGLWWYNQDTKPEGASQYPGRQIPVTGGAFAANGTWGTTLSGLKLVGNNDVAGLNNTNAWKAWITGTSKDITAYPAINALSNYTVTVAGTNSGWFIPSFAEYTNFVSESTVNADLKSSFMSLGETSEILDAIVTKGEWTSTEARVNVSSNRSEEVSYKNGNVGQTSGSGTTLPYRFAIAF